MPDPLSNLRPRVSVCMATYNGAGFVADQLKSILAQLESTDELVIVDDDSNDDTCDIIEGFCDPRIRLLRHTANAGVIATFEEAIRNANGEILFLSDQDDIWYPNKVARVLSEFVSDRDLTLVVTNAQLIDTSGKPMNEMFYGAGKTFRAGIWANIISCRFLGCTLALRSTLAGKALPIPADGFFLHDHWFGSLNAVLGGRTMFIDEPLVYYRRHENNVTGNRALGRFRQIQIRLNLIAALAWKRLSLKFHRSVEQ